MESTHPADTDQKSSGWPSLDMSSPEETSGWAMMPTLSPWSTSQCPIRAVPLKALSVYVSPDTRMMSSPSHPRERISSGVVGRNMRAQTFISMMKSYM